MFHATKLKLGSTRPKISNYFELNGNSRLKKNKIIIYGIRTI